MDERRWPAPARGPPRCPDGWRRSSRAASPARSPGPWRRRRECSVSGSTSSTSGSPAGRWGGGGGGGGGAGGRETWRGGWAAGGRAPSARVNSAARLGRGARAEQRGAGLPGNRQGEGGRQDRGAEQHQHGGGQPRGQEVARRARAKRSSDMSSPFGGGGGAQPVAIAERMRSWVSQTYAAKIIHQPLRIDVEAREGWRRRRCGLPRSNRRSKIPGSRHVGTRRPGQR